MGRARSWFVGCLVLGIVALFAACGGSGGSAGGDSGGGGGDSGGGGATATIGTAGGSVGGPASSALTVPAGALDGEVTFDVATEGNAALPEWMTAVSVVLHIGPSGTVFDPAASLALSYDATKVPEGDDPATITVYGARSPEGPWEPLATTLDGGVATAPLEHLSNYVAGTGCRQTGEGCSPERVCCDQATCVGTRCEACRPTGGACSTGFDCCRGNTCIDDHCAPCRGVGAGCAYPAECCNAGATACVEGLCSRCLREGLPCDNPGNCCGSLYCIEGMCRRECGRLGEGCLSVFDCCGWQTLRTKCNGGVCAECGQTGAPCRTTECCDAFFCDSGACAACKDTGGSCSADFQCCNRKCVDGQCAACLPDARTCDGPSDCCSGQCESHSCVACPAAGRACGGNGDCCPGSCCDGTGLTCFDGTCQTCSPLAGSCAFPKRCCGAFKCLEDECVECREAGGACPGNNSYYCCDGFTCIDSVCSACSADGENCDPDTPCCGGALCVFGKCSGCVADGGACENSDQCCTKDCQNGVCVGCVAALEGACDDDQNKCCEGLACEDGHCILTCALIGQPCDNPGDKPCCPGSECSGNTCVYCGTQGSECSGDRCCDGFRCLADDTCSDCGMDWEPCGTNDSCCPGDRKCILGVCTPCDTAGQACIEGSCCEGLECVDQVCRTPGGGGCSCDTPGATVTRESGCADWPDANECNGWVSVVIGSQGWDFMNDHDRAMAYEVPSGTSICAMDCCISLTCPAR